MNRASFVVSAAQMRRSAHVYDATAPHCQAGHGGGVGGRGSTNLANSDNDQFIGKSDGSSGIMLPLSSARSPIFMHSRPSGKPSTSPTTQTLPPNGTDT